MLIMMVVLRTQLHTQRADLRMQLLFCIPTLHTAHTIALGTCSSAFCAVQAVRNRPQAQLIIMPIAPSPSIPLEATHPGDPAIIRTLVDDPGGAGFSLPGRHLEVATNGLEGTRACIVEIPARIGFSVADMTTFGPAKPGGGGVGMALKLCSTTYVAVSPCSHVRDPGVKSPADLTLQR